MLNMYNRVHFNPSTLKAGFLGGGLNKAIVTVGHLCTNCFGDSPAPKKYTLIVTHVDKADMWDDNGWDCPNPNGVITLDQRYTGERYYSPEGIQLPYQWCTWWGSKEPTGTTDDDFGLIYWLALNAGHNQVGDNPLTDHLFFHIYAVPASDWDGLADITNDELQLTPWGFDYPLSPYYVLFNYCDDSGDCITSGCVENMMPTDGIYDGELVDFGVLYPDNDCYGGAVVAGKRGYVKFFSDEVEKEDWEIEEEYAVFTTSGTYIENNGKIFICITSHTASSANEPTGYYDQPTWQIYWEEIKDCT